MAQYEGEMTFAEALALSTGQEYDASADPEVNGEPAEGAESAAEAPEGEEGTEATPEPQEAAEAEPEAPEPSPAEQRSLARLIERENALDKRKAELEAMRAEIEAAKAQNVDFQTWQEDFKIDPVSTIREAYPDADLKALAQDLWNEAQGNAAPPAYRATKDARAARLEAARARREMEGSRKRAEEVKSSPEDGNQVLDQYVADLRGYAEQVDVDKFPLVARLSKHDAQRALGGMFGHAQRVAQESGGRTVLTPEQAAEALEKELRFFKSLGDDSAAEPSKTPSGKQEASAQPTTLRNNHTKVQPGLEAEDELSDEYLRRKAFEAIGLDPATA